MNFKLRSSIDHLFVLGAGASVDYGLPTWKELPALVKEKIRDDSSVKYKYHKEILEWLDMVGDTDLGKYQTIDECIKCESVEKNYHDNGDEIEEEMFRIINEVLSEQYVENKENGWIRILNDLIVDEIHNSLEHKIAFLNYNYDDVLIRNFLIFDYLPSKRKKISNINRLRALEDVRVSSFHPHGYFPSDIESRSIDRFKDTSKTDLEQYTDVVSCYESKAHVIVKNNERGLFNESAVVALYILGLGTGLGINLKNISFKVRVSEIHITVRDEKNKQNIEKTLIDIFKIDPTKINIYKDCRDLISSCFRK